MANSKRKVKLENNLHLLDLSMNLVQLQDIKDIKTIEDCRFKKPIFSKVTSFCINMKFNLCNLN